MNITTTSPLSDAELARFIEAARTPTIGESAELNRERKTALERRAKVAYDAYTVAAGTHSPVPFIRLWPRERSGWIAVAQALEPEEKRIP
jgi:hypothetical protein